MNPDATLLRVLNVSARYGSIPVLRRVSFHVRTGEIVALIGANGAGKSTLLKVVSGMHPATDGEVLFAGEAIQGGAPERIVRKGLVQVPEARQLFPSLTVMENLELGGYVHGRRYVREHTEQWFELFPALAARRRQRAGTLSGGEQQMLSLARALMAKPKLLVLDEPSLGLAPLIVAEIYRSLAALRQQGLTILLVEQNALGALQLADRGYALEAGRVLLAGSAAELLQHDDIRRAYLGKDYRHKWEK